MAVKNQSEMKDGNIRSILRTMLWEGPISRSDLCKKTGLTPSAVSALTRELLEKGMIEELGPEDKKNQGAGRPPSLLQLNDRSCAAIGVEIGVDHLALGVVSLTGKLYNKVYEKMEPDEQPHQVFARIISFFNEQRQNLTGKGVQLAGLGIAVTGLVDTKRGINRFAPNLGWRDVNVKEELSNQLDTPVIVDNNVRLMALGEEWFGAAKNSGSLIFVQVGAGVGCGIVLPRVGLLRGAFDGAGELGHCTVLPGGPLCKCGKRGCLEALVSERALIGSYRQRTVTRSNRPVDPREITVDMLVEAASRGDVDARNVLKEAAGFLGIGLATIINIFEPRQIVFNGNAFVLSPLTRSWIYESTRQHCFSCECRVEFNDASFKNFQGVVGAATAVLQQEIY